MSDYESSIQYGSMTECRQWNAPPTLLLLLGGATYCVCRAEMNTVNTLARQEFGLLIWNGRSTQMSRAVVLAIGSFQ
jgi:hypothetical protein